MLKKITAVILFAVILLSLTACMKITPVEATPSPSPSLPPTSTPVPTPTPVAVPTSSPIVLEPDGAFSYDPALLGMRAAAIIGPVAADFYTNQLIPAILARQKRVTLPPNLGCELNTLRELFRSACPLEALAGTLTLSLDSKELVIGYEDTEALTDEEYNEKLNALSAAIDNALNNSVKDGYTRLETVLALYEYLAKNVSYDYEAENNRAYGALVNGKCNCNGYSEALMVLLTQLGQDEGYLVEWLSDDPNESSHMWNALLIDNEWYYFDVTWESGSTLGAGLTYFGINNSQRGESYPPEEYTLCPQYPDLSVPDVTGERFSYLKHCGLAYIELDQRRVRFYAPAEGKWYVWSTADDSVKPE